MLANLRIDHSAHYSLMRCNMRGQEAPWERPLIVLIINIFGGHVAEVKQGGQINGDAQKTNNSH